MSFAPKPEADIPGNLLPEFKKEICF